ncbi:heavy-metal-associated domain-containing protein [Micromonospora sp. NPDC047548]|uniref:heavy-metal-associated domain-containing protein n=1 Tax=Micromonospora sp. NPDC047548 TaxID=3155624 RepID=UPI0033F0673A
MSQIPRRGIFTLPAAESVLANASPSGAPRRRPGPDRYPEEIFMCTNESSCGCATVTIDSAPAAAVTIDGLRSTYTVSGMTCGGCAKMVARHVGDVAGVTDVQVDVASGAITTISDAPLETADIRAAVERAGYRLAS